MKKSEKKTKDLALSKAEAKFLYRLFSVYVSNGEEHVSQSLAKCVQTPKTEKRLFEKILKVCDEHGVKHGEKTKDFGLMVVDQPKTAVVQIEVTRRES